MNEQGPWLTDPPQVPWLLEETEKAQALWRAKASVEGVVGLQSWPGCTFNSLKLLPLPNTLFLWPGG